MMKKGQERPVKGHNYEFLPLTSPNLGHLECYTPYPKQHMVLKVLTENTVF